LTTETIDTNVSNQTVSVWPIIGFIDLSIDEWEDDSDPSSFGVSKLPVGDELYLTYPIESNCLNTLSISYNDVQRIIDNQWLHDTLIDLKIRFFVESRHDEVEWYDRFHIFNSLFYSAIISAIKIKKPLVPKWTKNVDLFSKDFSFIPICYSQHWSLCVVVRPWQWLSDNYINQSEQYPLDTVKEKNMGCILFMDSLGMHKYKRDAKIIKLYLSVEWKRKHYRKSKEVTELDMIIDSDPDKIIFSGIPVIQCTSAPKQFNGFDCGMFVAKYVEEMITLLPSSTQTDLDLCFGNHINETSFTADDIILERQVFVTKMAEKRLQWITYKQRVLGEVHPQQRHLTESPPDDPQGGVEFKEPDVENRIGSDTQQFHILESPALTVDLDELVLVGTLYFFCQVNFQFPNKSNVLLTCGSFMADGSELFLFYAANTIYFTTPPSLTDALYVNYLPVLIFI